MKILRNTPVTQGCPSGIAALDLAKSALLEASAGTGKTFAIEHLVLRLLLETETELPGILVLTFTEKATGELKEKIRNRIGKRISEGGLPAQSLARLKEAQLNFDRASIFTIHGFCQRVLRNYAFENNALFRTELVKEDNEVLTQVLAEEMRSTWLTDAGVGQEGLQAFRNLAEALNLTPTSKWTWKILNIAKNFNPLRGDLLLPVYDEEKMRAIDGRMLAALEDAAVAIADPEAFLRKYRTIKFANATLKKKAPELIEAALRLVAAAKTATDPNARIRLALDFLKSVNLNAVKQNGFGCLMPKPDDRGAHNPMDRYVAHNRLSAVRGSREPFHSTDPCGYFAALPWPELENLLLRLEEVREAAAEKAGAEKALAFVDQRRVIVNLRDKAQAFKREEGLISFDDMIEDLCLALREKPDLVRALKQQYRACLVDEFQDTDPLQWEIFRRIFLDAPPKSQGNTGATASPLFLIGDPKQAIYRFRGGDIHTYMDARKALYALSRAGGAQGLSLDTNFRSSRAMVTALNAVFPQAGWFHPLSVEDGDAAWRLSPEPDPLGYVQVNHGGLPIQECRDATEYPAPIVLRDFSAEPTKVATQRAANAWIVAEIAALMAAPERLRIPDKASGTLRSLGLGDICILVKTNKEKAYLEKNLFRAGIPFQVDKRTGLYQSEAAAHFLAVLESLENPADAGLHARALLTRFFRAAGEPPPTHLPGETHPCFEAWSRMAARRQWQRLIHAMLYRTGLLYRESLEPDGDRRIMDFLHIGQNLVLEALRDNLSLSGLVQKLRDLKSDAGGDEENGMHREESEGGKVVLMTMHGSKGLEFPVVFLAAFSGPPPQDYFKYRLGPNTVYNLDKQDADAKAAYDAEAEGEERRLFYVALTRARYKLFIPLLPASYGGRASGPLGGFAGEALRRAAAERPELFHWSAGGETSRLPRAFEDAAGRLQEPRLPGTAPSIDHASAETFSLQPLPFDPEKFLADYPRPESATGESRLTDFSKRRRRLTSYSHLVRRNPGPTSEELEGRYEKDDAPNPSHEDEASTAEAVAPIAANALPRGKETGNMFHEILEEIDFAIAGAAPSPEYLLELPPIRDLMLARMREHRLEETHLGGVAAVIWNTLRSPVPDPFGAAPFRLSEVESRKHEMEFLFPFRKNELGASPIERKISGSSDAQGYLWGYIDLIFRHAGRYYLLDWKSNWLESYTTDVLEKDIRECRYDLQYMLYSIALDKWLRNLIPDYDYDRHFGGIHYIYLRGMGSADSGAYALRPTASQMQVDFPRHLEHAMGLVGPRVLAELLQSDETR